MIQVSYQSHNIISKIFYVERRDSNRKYSGINKRPDIIQNFNSGQISLNKTWLNFWGVTNSTPLKKILSSRFVKGGRTKCISLLRQRHTNNVQTYYAI